MQLKSLQETYLIVFQKKKTFIDSFPFINNKLFDNVIINNNIRMHPMIEWKKLNNKDN